MQSEQNVIYRLMAGRPKLTYTEKDCREWKLTTVDPQERSTWRSDVRSAMPAASQLPVRGSTDMDDAPSPVLHVNQRSDMMYDMIGHHYLITFAYSLDTIIFLKEFLLKKLILKTKISIQQKTC